MSDFLTEEVTRSALVVALFLVVFALAEAWRKFGEPEPEWTRKFVHVAAGGVVIALPWILRSHWSVLVLGAGLSGLLLLTRRRRLLASVHGVARRSEGAIYFPVAVYLVFRLAAGQPVFYLVSTLTLVVADALAALVGSSYGRLLYPVEQGRRSLEGSVVFFLAAFLAVHLPLLLMTGVDRAVSVLVALQIALLVTMVEAISLEGMDNLLVPVGVFLLLQRLTPMPAELLVRQLAAQLVILGVLSLLAWRLEFLTAAGTLAGGLFLLGAWSLAGPAWVVPPIAALMAFALVLRLATTLDRGPAARFQVLAVFHATLVPALLVILGDAVPRAGDGLFPLFAGALAAQLGLLCLVFWQGTPWVSGAPAGRVIASALVGVVSVLPVAALVDPGFGLAQAGPAAGLPLLALVLYLLANRIGVVPKKPVWDGRLQAACVGVSALLLAPMMVV